MIAGRTEPQSLTWLFNFVRPFNVHVTSTTGGHHVPGSYHWAHRAIDVAGTPTAMAAVQAAALRHAREFREAFYDPAGRYVKNGRVKTGQIGGHRDHVHLAR